MIAKARTWLGRRRSAAIEQARRLLSQGLYDEYLAFVEGAVGEFPDDLELLLGYALALAPTRPEEARAQARRAAELEHEEDPWRLVRAASVLAVARAPG
jgi:hypothetical protein